MAEMERRLTILTRNEIQDLYDLPRFTDEERAEYFYISPPEMNELENLRTISSKIYLILQLGYFKAKKRFFTFQLQEVKDDIYYISQKYYPEYIEVENIRLPRTTRIYQQKYILKLFNYKLFTRESKKELQDKAFYLATIHAKPVYIFKELFHYLEKQRIILPGYTTMQDIVSKAISTERERLKTVIMGQLSEEAEKILDNLLNSEDGLHEITLLKKEPKNFGHKEMSQEVKNRELTSKIYYIACKFLKNIGISNENIKYYASLVKYYSVYKLKRMDKETAYIYLTCFIFNRYEKINDNLINAFIYYISKYVGEAKDSAKEKVYEYKVEGNKHLKSAGKILKLFVDDSIPEEIEFKKIKEFAFSIIEKDKISFLSSYISKTRFDTNEYEWEHYVELAQKFKINLRYIFKNLEFKNINKKTPLMKAVIFLKNVFTNNKSLQQVLSSEFPCKFITSKLKKYIYEEKTIEINGKSMKRKELNVDKYEFLVYRLLKDKLETGEVFISGSQNFKSLEEDLIDNETWEKKEELIQKIDVPSLYKPVDELLNSFQKELDNKIYTVNKRIQEGQNPHIKITGKGDNLKWTLPYKKKDEKTNNPMYAHINQIGISDVLYFVNEKTNFLSSFTHILDRFVKSEPHEHRLSACILAYGTNIGLSKMAGSSDLTYDELSYTANSFIRPATLKAANDKISNSIADLPIFKYYNIQEDMLHSSSDGQKFETQFETINSRYSSKYFGLNKGITSYTLVANHIPVNSKIIGANEHESHYVLDLLFNNTSDINPEVHSTDSMGVNQINFILLHLFGYKFAPRYKNLNSKAKIIYSFKNINEYEDFLFKPIRKIKTQLIKEEWENIEKIIVSLALKSTTQSTIIRKLNSYKRKNKTRQALVELDNIARSIHILNYIDSIEFRRNIQKAINRVEGYHRLKRAIFYDNFGKFRVKTELGQQIWSECTRLIANIIIFYNAVILSKLIEHTENLEKIKEMEVIKRISPVAWRHINLYGQYKFYKKDNSINLDRIIEGLEKNYLGVKK
ncbi:MAG: Tn3 family transposase [Candidatus Margulisbacteria bacterium]|nr:Tn3 family transposase [Candidatus Margulisiibacteriota bacterium]